MRRRGEGWGRATHASIGSPQATLAPARRRIGFRATGYTKKLEALVGCLKNPPEERTADHIWATLQSIERLIETARVALKLDESTELHRLGMRALQDAQARQFMTPGMQPLSQTLHHSGRGNG